MVDADTAVDLSVCLFFLAFTIYLTKMLGSMIHNKKLLGICRRNRVGYRDTLSSSLLGVLGGSKRNLRKFSAAATRVASVFGMFIAEVMPP